MLSFFKKIGDKKRQHATEMMEWHAEDIEKLPENAQRFHEQGNHALAFQNHCGRLRAYSDLALLQWRRGIDPRATIEGLASFYPMVISYIDENDPDGELELRTALFGFDTDLMNTMAWLAGLSSELHDHAKPDRPFFYGCSNYLLRIAMGIDVSQEDAADFLGQITAKSTLPHSILQQMAKMLGVIDSTESLNALVANAERNWKLRETSKFFEKHVGTTSGFGNTNYLYLDFYLAAALKKVGWQGKSIHQWAW